MHVGFCNRLYSFLVASSNSTISNLLQSCFVARQKQKLTVEYQILADSWAQRSSILSMLLAFQSFSRTLRHKIGSIYCGRSMSNFVVDPPPVPFVEVDGSSDVFPVHRVYCVGRNYAEHAWEMGSDPNAEPPCFFCKPADGIVNCGGGSNPSIPYPLNTNNLHYEVELVIALKSGGANIPRVDAEQCVFGFGVGVDLTRRDLQKVAKELRQPWDLSKAFDRSAPISKLYPSLPDEKDPRLYLNVNGVIKQEAPLSQMIYSVHEIIAILSKSFELKPGDLIFTGTPAGVGAIQPNDRVDAGLHGLCDLSFTISTG